MEDHPDCGSADIQELKHKFLPIADPLVYMDKGVWRGERCFLGCKKQMDEVAMAVQGCWRTSPQDTSLAKLWGLKGW